MAWARVVFFFFFGGGGGDGGLGGGGGILSCSRVPQFRLKLHSDTRLYSTPRLTGTDPCLVNYV